MNNKNGIIVINKDKGYTSFDVVSILRKKLGIKKIGHTGTLDPNATGVLIIVLNKYTKLVDLITSYDKEYEVEMILGKTTTTLDPEGDITQECDVSRITDDDIKSVLKEYVKTYNQEVPLYSAVKINGKKLYEYARSNREVILPSKEVSIYKINLNSIERIDETINVKFTTRVSKGTYIRSLVRDIANSLNNVAYMNNLRRVKQGNISIDDAYTLNDIEENNYKVLSIEDVIEIETKVIDDTLKKDIMNGNVVDKFFNNDLCLLKDQDNQELAIYQVYDKDNNKVKPYVMLK